MKIVFLDENSVVFNNDIDFSELESLGEYKGYRLKPDEDPVQYCGGVEVIISNKVRIRRKHIGLLPHLKLICVAATGYDNIDIQAAKDRDIRMANVEGYATNAVVQHVWALILSFTTRVCDYYRDVSTGEWYKSETFNLLRYPTFELGGKKLGIIGFGSIGKGIAKIAEAFEMKVMAHDIVDISDTGYKNYPIDLVLRDADIVSINCPLTEQTRNIINAESFRKMKKSAILINTARGSIVNEADLAEALNSGIIAGAAVDTLSKEPPDEGSSLLDDVKNIIITPHCAWSTRDSRQRLIDSIVEKIKNYLKGNYEGFIV